MKLFAKLCILVCILLLPAWPAVITITITEASQNQTAPPGVTFNSGVLILCEAFDPTAAVCSGSNVSDVVTLAGGNLIIYNPTVNDPGGSLVPGDSYTYRIFSDVPEPPTLFLLGAALIGLGIMHRLPVAHILLRFKGASPVRRNS